MQTIKNLFVAVAATGLVALTSVAQAQSTEGNSIPCLRLSRIQDVDIIDNTRIVFRSGVNDYYLNTLPYTCHGLRRNDSFMYQTSLNEICNVDTITLLDTAGPGYTAGISCGLGNFEPISKEQISTLKSTL